MFGCITLTNETRSRKNTCHIWFTLVFVLPANVCMYDGIIVHPRTKSTDLGSLFLFKFSSLWFCPEFYELDNEIQDRDLIL